MRIDNLAFMLIGFMCGFSCCLWLVMKDDRRRAQGEVIPPTKTTNNRRLK